MRAYGALVLAAMLLGCGGPRPPRPSSTLVKLAEIPKLPYLAPLNYSVHYGLFRDLGAPPWGKGKVLAAHWRKDFGYESELRGLTASANGPLVLEMAKNSFQGILHRLDASGVTVSSAPMAAEVLRALSGRGEKLAVLASADASVLDLGTGLSVPLAPRVDRVLAADLDGDGQDEVVVHSWQENSVSAYRADGRKLWSKGGFPRLYALEAGRLDAARSGVLLSGGGSDFKANHLVALDGSGRVLVSTPVSWSALELSHLADLGDGPRLVSVGYAYPSDRRSLKVSRLGAKALEPLWETDLGWTSPSALASADLDGDGRKELLVGTKNGWLLVFSAEGKPLAEKNVIGEITHMEAWGKQVLVAVKGIPPELYAVGVIDDPGPWKP